MTGKCPFGGDNLNNFNPLENTIVESRHGLWKIYTWYFMNEKAFESKSLLKSKAFKRVERYRQGVINMHKELK